MTTFGEKEIKNGTKVQNITLELVASHPELNEIGIVTPVNLGEFSVELKDGILNIQSMLSDRSFQQELKSAYKAIMLTYLLKQSQKEG